MGQRQFLIAALLATVVVRLVVIIATPHSTQLDDLRIYQGTGRVVLAGLNPYDFDTAKERREELRHAMALPGQVPDRFTDTAELWNYYVSGNLPASTALYAAFEWLSRGNSVVWRFLFIAGDIGILLGLYALLRTVRGSVRERGDQAGLVALCVVNPILVVSGCAMPEDKQFQTALMLLGASVLLDQRRRRDFLQGLGAGALLSLATLFKAFGIFLIPLWLKPAGRNGLRYVAGSVVGAAFPAVLALLAFGTAFFNTVGARAVSNSFSGATHASPWVLLGGLAPADYMILKAAVVVLLSTLLLFRWRKGHVDLLNFCAGLCLVFVTLWLDRGAMNRMNIGIMFATAALASIAPISWYLLALFSSAISGLAYLVGYGLRHIQLETIDAVLTTLFLVAYFALIWALPYMRVRSTARAAAKASTATPADA